MAGEIGNKTWPLEGGRGGGFVGRCVVGFGAINWERLPRVVVRQGCLVGVPNVNGHALRIYGRICVENLLVVVI